MNSKPVPESSGPACQPDAPKPASLPAFSPSPAPVVPEPALTSSPTLTPGPTPAVPATSTPTAPGPAHTPGPVALPNAVWSLTSKAKTATSRFPAPGHTIFSPEQSAPPAQSSFLEYCFQGLPQSVRALCCTELKPHLDAFFHTWPHRVSPVHEGDPGPEAGHGHAAGGNPTCNGDLPVLRLEHSDRGGYCIHAPWYGQAWHEPNIPCALCSFAVDLVTELCARNGHILCLHAAAVHCARGAVLLLGDNRSGKSTFTVRLMACGYETFGDDMLGLLPDQRIFSFGIAPRLRLPLPRSARLAKFVQQYKGPGDERYQYLTPDMPFLARFARTSPVACALILQRRECGCPKAERIPTEQAMLHLFPKCIPHMGTLRQAFDQTACLADQLELHVLHYADLDSAAQWFQNTFGPPPKILLQDRPDSRTSICPVNPAPDIPCAAPLHTPKVPSTAPKVPKTKTATPRPPAPPAPKAALLPGSTSTVHAPDLPDAPDASPGTPDLPDAPDTLAAAPATDALLPAPLIPAAPSRLRVAPSHLRAALRRDCQDVSPRRTLSPRRTHFPRQKLSPRRAFCPHTKLGESWYIQVPGNTLSDRQSGTFLLNHAQDTVLYLNPTAQAIWHMLKEPMQCTQAISLLQETFTHIPKARIAEDIRILFRDLLRAGLITRCPAPGKRRT